MASPSRFRGSVVPGMGKGPVFNRGNGALGNHADMQNTSAGYGSLSDPNGSFGTDRVAQSYYFKRVLSRFFGH